MKKFFCCLGLFFSGFVINTTLAYLLIILTITMLNSSVPTFFMIDIVILILIAVGITLVIQLFRKKLNINAPMFIISFQLPTAVLSTAYFIFIKFNGFLFNILNDSEMEYILTLATSISSTIILYLTVITCLVIYIVRKVSEKRNSKLELNSI
ncbi:MAG: hypothetical protein UHK60_07525 [Acutalibacteraceae bacterium]|nr:hypothetical protein [Acutalibacteraceae bacterium]